MEVKVIVEISAKEYFDFVISTIQAGIDVSDCQNKTLRKGLKYKKAMKVGLGKTTFAEIKVIDYVYPKIIEMEYKTDNQININKYLILPKDNNQCEVIYTETLYDRNRKIKPINKFIEKSYIKKIEKRMKNVAKYLIEKKNENQTEK